MPIFIQVRMCECINVKMYSNSNAAANWNGSLSKFHGLRSGARQGGALSPNFLVFYMNKCKNVKMDECIKVWVFVCMNLWMCKCVNV